MVRIRLVGSFVSFAQTDQIDLDISQETTIMGLIEVLKKNKTGEKLINKVLDPELLDPRPNTLILVNGREIGTLDGLNTKIGRSDVITMLPVSHGG